jgi:hypothetical protein
MKLFTLSSLHGKWKGSRWLLATGTLLASTFLLAYSLQPTDHNASMMVSSISISESSGATNNDGRVCIGASFTLTAVNPTGGSPIQWRLGSPGGPLLNTGNSYSSTGGSANFPVSSTVTVWAVDLGNLLDPDDDTQVSTTIYTYQAPFDVTQANNLERCEADDNINLNNLPAFASYEDLTFSGPGVNGSGIFDPSAAGVGSHQIDVTFPCPDPNGQQDLFFITVYENPVSTLEDQVISCTPFDNNSYNLIGLFTNATTSGGTWNVLSSPGATSINGDNLDITTPGCYEIQYTAPNTNGCEDAPAPSTANLLVLKSPAPSFIITSGNDVGCTTTSTSVTVEITSPEYGFATPSYQWIVTGQGTLSNATSANPTITIDAPAAGMSNSIDISLIETFPANSNSCGFAMENVACSDTTTVQTVTVYNDGLDCMSSCESIEGVDVCEIATNPSLDLGCNIFTITGPDIVDAKLDPNGGVLNCDDEEVAITYNGNLAGVLGSATTAGPTIGSFAGPVCDILTFSIDIPNPLPIGPDPLVSIRPFGFLPDFILDACDKTIGEFIVDALGEALGGDGGGGQVWADTDGDGAFDTLVDEGPIEFDGSANVPNNVEGQGTITIRSVVSWPNSPQTNCGDGIQDPVYLLDIIPIGAIPLVGPPIEDVLAAGGCDVDIAFSDEETRSWQVINNAEPVFANCPTTDLTFSDQYACDTEANWSIPVAYDGCDGTVLPFITDPANTDPGVRQISGPQPGDDLAIGTYLVEYQATGCSGMTTTCSFNVVISPGEPTLVCPNDVTVGTDVDQCTAVVTGLTPLSGIGCNTTITYSTTGATTLSSPTTGINDISGATFNLGVTNVTYTMSYDDDGDPATDPIEQTCTFSVTVEDDQRPTIACKDLTDVQLDNTGNVTVTATQIDGGSIDNCGIATVELAGNGQGFGPSVTFDCSNIGPNTVNLQVTDDAGNTRRCLATVQITDFFEDFELALDVPELCLEANNPSQLDFTNYLTVTLPNGTNIPHSQVSNLGPMVIGAFGISAFVPAPGSGMTIGTDPDNPGDIGYVDPATGEYTPGTGNGFVTISYILTIGDQIAQNGALITGCYEIVHDVFELRQPLDMGSPECECFSFEERLVDMGIVTGGLEPYTIQYEGATLDIDGDGTPDDFDGEYVYEAINGHDIQDFMEDLGELRVEYTQPVWSFTIVDARGCELFRSGSCDNDDLTEGPTITCPDNPATLFTEELVCEAHYEWTHPLPNDNCAVVLYSYQILNPDGSIDGPHNLNALLNINDPAPLPELFEAEYEFEKGVSIVSYYAEDAVGNFITCQFEVTVEDDDPPYFINCPYPPVVENAETDHCDAYVNFALPLAEDNCDVPTVTQIDDTGLEVGDRFPVGTTILYYEAEDLSGNKDTCQVKVIVNDYWEVPLISCPDDVVQGTDDWRCDAAVFDIEPEISSPCQNNLSVVYEIFADEALTDRISCGVWDASGEIFEKGDSWVKYTVSSQPLLLITEISQSGGTDQMEITNLGPATLDISCLTAARVTDNPDADEILDMVTMLPSLAPTIVGVGETFVFDFTFDGGATMGACYTISYFDVLIDQVAVNGFADCEGFTGTLDGGDVYRTCEADSDDAADWAVAELCFPLTIGDLNPDLTAMPDNGTETSLQTVEPAMAMCDFKVTIEDDEDPFCGELAVNTLNYPGAGIPDVSETECNRSFLTITDGCIIGTLTFNLNGTVTPANSTITLISPEGTEVTITELPAMPDDFYAQKSDGEWILDIEPNAGAGPLSVTDWSLDIVCMEEFVMADVVLDNDPGLCGAEFTWTHPFFVDNCFVGTIEVEYTSDDADCVPEGGLLAGVGGFEVTEFFCVGTTTVTYTLTDEAGNVHQCGFDVTVNDVEDPVIECPNDIVINLSGGECRENVCFAPDLAIDNCAVIDTISTPEPCTYFEIGITEVTITIVDEAGNDATCTFTIEIIEYVPDDYTLFCNDLLNISLGPDCEEEITADMILEGNDYHCYEDYEITVIGSNGFPIPTSPFVNSDHFNQTFTVMVFDPDSGNTCWGEIFVEDKQAPEFDCPADTTLTCNLATDPDFTGFPELTSCEVSVTESYLDVFNDFGACSQVRGEIVRTWTMTDESNNSSTCTQVITIERLDLTEIVYPPSYDGFDLPPFTCTQIADDPTLTDIVNTGVPTINGIDVETGSFCNIAVNVNDEVFNICEGSYDILRTWSIYNPCEPAIPGVNPIQHLQVIKVLDNVSPTVNCPDDIVVSTDGGTSCEATVLLPELDIEDACSSFEVQTNTPNGTLNSNGGLIFGLGLGSYPITYVVTDDCVNVTECNLTLTVEDLSAPTPICDEITQVDLTSNGAATVQASVFDDGSYDNCCLDGFLVRRMDGDCAGNFDEFGPSVDFCCSDVGNGPVMVVFRAVDCYGNVNDCMVQVLVGDKLPPITQFCPAPQTISCDDYQDNYAAALDAGDNSVLNIFGTPLFFDNCDLDIDTTVTVNVDQCGNGSITRTWSATDPSGNFPAVCTQVITVEHVSDWVVEFPEDITAQCVDGQLPDLGEPEVFFDECELIAVSHDDVQFDIVPDACYKIERTWAVINWCVYDDFGFDAYEELSEADLLPSFIDWDGDGDNDDRTFRDGFNDTGLPGTPDGYISYKQIIKVIDEDEPEFNIPAIDGCIVDTDCDGDILLPYPDITDECSPEFQVDITGDLGTFTDISGDVTAPDVEVGTYSITYAVTDNCGNTAYQTIELDVEDCKKPTPYCQDLIIEIMQTGMVDVWAEDFDAGSFDNCGPVDPSFSATDPDADGLTFTCDDLGEQDIEVYFHDIYGNVDFCIVTLDVQDNMDHCGNGGGNLTIAGTIETENATTVEDVMVDVNGGTFTELTGADGTYSFDLPAGNDYTVTPMLDENPLNGVTTYDLVLIMRHILTVDPLASPYQMIAADANNSQSVTTLDIVEIRKVILFLEPTFPANTSWRFVDADYIFPDPQDPWSTPYPEVLSYNNLNASDLNADFVAVKVGDVNQTAQSNSQQQMGNRTFFGSLELEAPERVLQPGVYYSVPVTANDMEVLGYQFTLQWDADALALTDLRGGVATLENFNTGMVNEGVLTTSWNDSKPYAYGTDEVLFELIFQANTAGKLSDFLEVSSRYTPAEAYGADGSLLDVQLNIGGQEVGDDFALYQNVPNPFGGQTRIGFRLPNDGPATLTILDVSGKVVQVIKGEYTKGYHEVQLDDLQVQAGVLYYRLDTEEHSATRRMLLIQ